MSNYRILFLTTPVDNLWKTNLFSKVPQRTTAKALSEHDPMAKLTCKLRAKGNRTKEQDGECTRALKCLQGGWRKEGSPKEEARKG